MFRRIKFTWSIMGASWEVLKKDKELLIFPILSFIAMIIVSASFIVPILLTSLPELEGLVEHPEGYSNLDNVLYYVVLFAFYFCNYFVIIFFNSAIVGSAVTRMRGGEPTFGDALKIAFSRLPQILGWALMSATVGMILRMIEERSQMVGRIVAGLLGVAWTLTTYLALPVLVVEQKGPVETLKRSASLLKTTWGDQIVGNFSFGIIFFLLMLPAFLLIPLAVMAGGTTTFVIIGVMVLYIALLALIQATLQTIFQAAIYLYATDGKAPALFPQDVLAGAIAQK